MSLDANYSSLPLTSTAAPDDRRDKAEANLWRWNAAMGTLHLIQGAVALGLSFTGNIAKFKIDMITSQPSWARGYPEVAIQSRGQMPFAGVASGFAFLSSAAHFIVLADFARYKTNLRAGINVHRWYEYALSSTLMIVLIAMLFGNTDALSLTSLAGEWRVSFALGYAQHLASNSTSPLTPHHPRPRMQCQHVFIRSLARAHERERDAG